MKVLLIDVDGKLPNLALMKLSTYYKQQGHEVYLNTCDKPDIVHISTLFSWNRRKVEKLLVLYPQADIGGTGWDLKKKLPEEIESCVPDYSLYTTERVYERIKGGIGKKENKIKKAQTICNAGIGFTSRGCIRNCEFCVVPKKEGKFHQVAEIGDIIKPGNNTLILLDNNLTADPDCIRKLQEIKKRDLVVDITQGIDVRLLTPDVAKALSEVKHLRSIHYAWDLMPFEKSVFEGIRILSQHVKPYKHLCMILTGFNTTFEQDEYRFKKLSEKCIDPYIMPYNKTFPSEKHRHFARWVNGRIYKVCSFREYEPWVKEQENKQISLFA